MADINVPVSLTNDPSYLNSSQGTDRASLQPLASVPELSTKYVSPDYQANRSAGTAIKGVGDLAESALKLTDQIIQKQADDTLTEGINKIRDSFGVGAAASNPNLAQGVGAAGAEGVSLLENDQSGTPIQVNRLGNRIDGLNELYRQGGLSNSAYYAKLESFVRQTKAQFPGYGNEIDSMVATKVGTTPANALRSALLQDVTSLQNKVQALNDKWTTYEHQKADVIYTLYPNYDQLKAQGKISRAEVEAGVGKFEAQQAATDRDMKALALNKARNENRSDQAYDLALRQASNISRNITLGVTNTLGINTSADLQKYITDVQTKKRPQPNPDELQQLTGLFGALQLKADAAFTQWVNKPLSQNSTETVASVLRSPEKIAQARQIAQADIQTIKDGLLNNEHGLVAANIQWNKANDAAADKKLATNMPNSDIIGALHRRIGDQTLSNLIIDSNTQMLPDILQGIRQAGWVNLSNGVGLRQSIENMSKDDPSGAAARQHVKDGVRWITEPEKLGDKTLADTAFQSFFGPHNNLLIDAFNRQPGAQVQLYTDMVNPKMTSAISKRSKADQAQYTQWAEDGWTSVFQTQANGLNSVAESYKLNQNMKLKFDPESGHFSWDAPASVPKGYLGAANQKLVPINSAVDAIKDVETMAGHKLSDFVKNKLVVMGIEPGSAVYNSIDDAIRKAEASKNPT